MQFEPDHPGAHVHVPFTGSHDAPFMQWQLCPHSSPYCPTEQASMHFRPWDPRGQEQVPLTGSHDSGQMHLSEQFTPKRPGTRVKELHDCLHVLLVQPVKHLQLPVL